MLLRRALLGPLLVLSLIVTTGLVAASATNDGPTSTSASTPYGTWHPNHFRDLDGETLTWEGHKWDGTRPGESGRITPADQRPHVSFVTPTDGFVAAEPLVYGSLQVRASDPDHGTYDGAGIDRVEMVVTDTFTGAHVTDRTEYLSSYDFGPNLPNGTYTFTATAYADRQAGGGSTSTSITITVATTLERVRLPIVPTPTSIPPTHTPTPVPPTATPLPTATALPATALPSTALPATSIPLPPTATPLPPTPLPPTPLPTAIPTATPLPPTPLPPTPPPPTPLPTAIPVANVITNVVVDTSAPVAVDINAVSLAALNQVRANVGLAPLTLNATMSNFALNWSQEMTRTGFRHSGGPYGENIAWYSDFTLSPTDAALWANDAWVDSPGHYANMTTAHYTEVGIGFYQDTSGWWFTHVFR